MFKSQRRRGLCDSLPWEGKGGVNEQYMGCKPLPATSQSAAPLPREGIKNDLPCDGYYYLKRGTKSF